MGGDLNKQYADGNYAEVWFKSAQIEISEEAISNQVILQQMTT